MRTDGQVLAAEPASGDGLYEDSRFRSPPWVGADFAAGEKRIVRSGSRGEWLTVFKRLEKWPLATAVTVSMDSVMSVWWLNTAVLAFLWIAASAGSGIAIRAVATARAAAQASRGALLREVVLREDAEAASRHSERLGSLGRLTGGVSHDFNNMLTAIRGAVDLLEDQLGSTASEKVLGLLGMVRDGVHRGATLNQQMLAFARRQKLDVTTVDAEALVRAFAPVVRQALGETITLEVVVADDVRLCRADKVELQSSLLNLAINAKDAMPRGGYIEISVSMERLDAHQVRRNSEAKPGFYVAICFADDGVGMSAQVKQRAFEPFFTTKLPGAGTGLGLSQVYGFVRQVGGHVTIESAEGRGTSVTLYLPVSDEAVAVQSPSPEASSIGVDVRSLRVLLVEDDLHVRVIAAEFLQAAGFEVKQAGDGRQALALLESDEQFDVLFSDIVMPGAVDGIELARSTRRLRPGLPILLATGFAGDGEVVVTHPFEVMAKPYHRRAVVQRLLELTGTTQSVAK